MQLIIEKTVSLGIKYWQNIEQISKKSRMGRNIKHISLLTELETEKTDFLQFKHY